MLVRVCELGYVCERVWQVRTRACAYMCACVPVLSECTKYLYIDSIYIYIYTSCASIYYTQMYICMHTHTHIKKTRAHSCKHTYTEKNHGTHYAIGTK